jgi:trigger factor
LCLAGSDCTTQAGLNLRRRREAVLVFRVATKSIRSFSMPEETDPTAPDVDVTEQQDDAAEVKVDVAVEDAGTLKKKVTVTVPRSQIDTKFDEMYGELSRSAQVPGFRVGHAPRRLIEKRFGRDVSDDVRNSLIGESLGQALDQADLNTLGEPDLSLEDIDLPDSGDMSYSFEVEVAPEFDLPELKGIQIDKPLLAIDDERIDGYVDQIRQSRATFETSKGPASAGDMVVVNATITGEGCDPVQRPGLSLRVGPGQVEGLALIDLGDALTGKTVGETVSLTTDAPAVHPNEQWQEKSLTVELELTEISARKLPDADEAFAEAMGFESLATMREFVSQELESRLTGEVQRSMRNQICQHLLDSTEFDLPAGVAARHTQRALQRRYVDLLQRGVPREQIDENLTELQADAATQAMQELKLTFVLGKIAEAEGIEVTEDEINSRIAQMAQVYNRRPERLRQELSQDGSIQQVAVSLTEEKALDKLLAQAEVREITREEAEKEAEAKAKKSAKKAADKALAEETEAGETKAKKKAATKAATKAAKKAAKKTAKKTVKKAAPKAEKKAATKKTEKKVAKKAAKKTTKKATKKTTKK